jgi:hypothetical protein
MRIRTFAVDTNTPIGETALWRMVEKGVTEDATVAGVVSRSSCKLLKTVRNCDASRNG